MQSWQTQNNKTLLLTSVTSISDKRQPLFGKKRTLFKKILLDFQGHTGSFNESTQIVLSFSVNLLGFFIVFAMNSGNNNYHSSTLMDLNELLEMPRIMQMKWFAYLSFSSYRYLWVITWMSLSDKAINMKIYSIYCIYTPPTPHPHPLTVCGWLIASATDMSCLFACWEKSFTTTELLKLFYREFML